MNSSTQVVLLVSPLDAPLGTCSKQQAHMEGKLHRAFSIFLLDEHNNILLQRRALTKYHSGGLWTNACCSHPVGDILADAGIRLTEELGVSAELREIGHFVYRHVFENGMTEYEVDHVLLGQIPRNTPLSPAPEEADAVEWVSVEELARQLTKTPEKFTPWFITAAPIVLDHLNR